MAVLDFGFGFWFRILVSDFGVVVSDFGFLILVSGFGAVLDFHAASPGPREDVSI